MQMRLFPWLAAAFLAGCSHVDYAQLADSTTTAVGLSSGYVESNPVLSGLSWPYIAAVKIGATQAIKLTPPEICEPGLLGLTASGYGAALWNIGVMAGSGLAAIPIVMGLTVWQWENWTADARTTCASPPFWERYAHDDGTRP